MRKHMKHALALLLAVVLLMSGLPMAASAATEKFASVRIEGTPLDTNNRGTLDIKVQADTANGNLATMVVQFSFDNTLIDAVRSNGDSVTSGATCFAVNSDDGFSVMPPEWKVNGNRTTINVTFANMETLGINTETLVASFRYKAKSSEAAAQMAKGTFKLESGLEDFLVVSLKKGNTPVVAYKYTTDPETSPITLQGFTYPGSDKQTFGSFELATAGDATSVAVPKVLGTDASTQSATLEVTAAAKDTDGDAMAAFPADAVWFFDGTAPDGVTISGKGDTATLTVAPGAAAGTATVKITSGSVSATKAIAISRDTAAAAAVKIYSGSTEITGTTDTIVIPPASATSANTKTYTAKAFNQYGEEMSDTVTLTFATVDTNVTYSDGTVSVTKDATKGATYTLTAAVGSIQKELTISLTDLEVDWTAVDGAMKSSIVYGTPNSGAANNLPKTGTATAGITLNGSFAVKDASTVQTAGARKVSVVFTVTSAGDYKDITVEKEYDVEVTKKSVTVTAANKTKVYGEANPALTFTVPAGSLVGEDTNADLGVTLACEATTSSPAGTPVDITGTAISTNYEVTVQKGTLVINKATITGIQTAAPTATILANDANNAADKLKAAVSLPEKVTVTYKDGTAELPITWANAAESFNAKGGSYTFKGTVTVGTNFNAYNTPLTATLTVTPITGTLATALTTPVVIAKSAAEKATDYAAFKLPASITVNCDNGVAAQVITPEWSVPLNALKTKAVGSKTSVKVTNMPSWLTIADSALTVEIQITDKFPVTVTVAPIANVTFGTEVGDPVASQTAIDDGTDANGTFTYRYTGTTVAGKAYDSDDKPTDAGDYTVTATLVSDTHAGNGSTTFKITPKALSDSMIAAISNETYNKAAHTPGLTVTDGTTELIKGTDYTVAYTDNVNAGTATAAITGKWNYSGTASKSFTIEKASIAALVPAVSGTGEVGKVLAAGLEGVDPDELTWQWMRNGTDIPGATGRTYVLTAADSNKEIAVKAVSKEQNYTGTTAASEAVTVAKQEITGAVSIALTDANTNGTVDTGDTLAVVTTSVLPTEAQAGLTYQWLRNGEPIENATAASYTITADDAGSELSVVVSGVSDFAGELNAAVETGKTVLTGTITVSGTPGVGSELTAAVTGTPAGTTEGEDYEIVWTRDGEVIPGATGTTYTMTEDDYGKSVSAKLVAKGENITGEVVAAGAGIALPAAAPAAPVLKVTPSNGKLTATWTAPAAHGAPIQEYTLVLKDSTGATLETVKVNSDQTSYTFTGLVNGTEYSITLSAENAIGSTGSAAVAAKPKFSGGGSSTGSDPEEPDVPETCPKDNTCPIAKYQDVNPNGWYHDGVHYVLENNLMVGMDTRRFEPNSNLTRAQFAQILYNKEDRPAVSGEDQFVDTNPGAWYANAVLWASQKEIVSGYGNGIFQPNSDVTREQMAVMLYNYAGKPATSGALSAFTDADHVSFWAENAIKWAVENKIISGKGNGILDPKGTATRAEAATMLMKYCTMNEEK